MHTFWQLLIVKFFGTWWRFLGLFSVHVVDLFLYISTFKTHFGGYLSYSRIYDIYVITLETWVVFIIRNFRFLINLAVTIPLRASFLGLCLWYLQMIHRLLLNLWIWPPQVFGTCQLTIITNSIWITFSNFRLSNDFNIFLNDDLFKVVTGINAIVY